MPVRKGSSESAVLSPPFVSYADLRYLFARSPSQGKSDIPVTQAVITLINKATNKQNLAKLGEGYCSFF